MTVSTGSRFSVPESYDYTGLGDWIKAISDYADTYAAGATPHVITLSSQAGGKGFLAVTEPGATRRLAVYLDELGTQLAGIGISYSGEQLHFDATDAPLGAYLTSSTLGTLNVEIDALGAQLAGTYLSYNSTSNYIAVSLTSLAPAIAGAGMLGSLASLSVDPGTYLHITGGKTDVNTTPLAAALAGSGLTSSAGVIAVGAGTCMVLSADAIGFDMSKLGTGLSWDGTHINGTLPLDPVGGFGIIVAGTQINVNSPVLAGNGLTASSGASIGVGAGSCITVSADAVSVDVDTLLDTITGAGLGWSSVSHQIYATPCEWDLEFSTSTHNTWSSFDADCYQIGSFSGKNGGIFLPSAAIVSDASWSLGFSMSVTQATPETLTFTYLNVDDGFYLYVDGSTVLYCEGASSTPASAAWYFTAGLHTINVLAYNSGVDTMDLILAEWFGNYTSRA